MSNYNLHFFGCSFTNIETSITAHTFNNFRNVISQNTGHPCKNYSTNGRANEQIIDDLYNTNLFHLESNDIHIIQFSFNDRFGMYFDLEDKFVSMCKRENAENPTDKIKIDFYNNWLTYFYSRQNRIKEFKKQVDFVCTWLKSKNAKFICIGMDDDMDSEYFEQSFYERNNFIKFENTYSLYGYMRMNKLRISDISEYSKIGISLDFHLNNDGHQYLANKIIEKLQISKF
jgi:hypothetical protein